MFSGDFGSLSIKIFADGADLSEMLRLASLPWIDGLTTNPTLMRKAGVVNYETFARTLLDEIPTLPISFEVFADEFPDMARQAKRLASWGSNVYVKVPVTNTLGESVADLVHSLSRDGIKLNVTAITHPLQVKTIVQSLAPNVPAIVSVFAGRVADTGRDPVPLMQECLAHLKDGPDSLELLWASPREVLNLVQADALGCHIITLTQDLLKKLDLLGRDLYDFSLDTVRMFRRDADLAAYQL